MHKSIHPLAGRNIRIKAGATHPRHFKFGGQLVKLIDWNDILIGMPWVEHTHKKAEAIYMRRIEASVMSIPDDNEVVRCVLDKTEVLIHVTELDATETVDIDGPLIVKPAAENKVPATKKAAPKKKAAKKKKSKK